MRLLLMALALCAVALLVDCAAAPAPAGAPGGGPRTASDQTDADRRAAIRMELAALHYNQGEFETALDQIKLALAAKPELGAAFSLRGLVYASMGEDALAEESFARALQINPRDANTLHNRAWFLCQRDKFAPADALFEQALAVPQYRDAQRTYLAQGICDTRAGKLEEAERKLSRAYDLDPSNPTTASNLSDVLYRRGEYVRARFYIGRVNQRADQSNAQTLWLALRVENRLGNRSAVEELGRQLRNRFPQARETLAYDRGRLDE
jgi:type IV pilus assembly protein PilF